MKPESPEWGRLGPFDCAQDKLVFSSRTGDTPCTTYDMRIFDMVFEGFCEFMKNFVHFLALLNGFEHFQGNHK